MKYEGQICRPPMERGSYMLPIMVGCSYNACTFCDLFKHLEWRILPFEQVENECKRVASLHGNPTSIFFGDGNAFALDTEYLLRIIDMTKKYFPNVAQYNMDATVTSIVKKSDAELKALYKAGVRNLYLGIETALDDVLRFIKKDHTVSEAHTAIDALRNAGLIYNAHIMLGIAGAKRSKENAECLAQFLASTKPHRLINFSLFIPKGVPLYTDVQNGLFVPATELEKLEEDRMLVRLLGETVHEEILYDSFHDLIQYRVRGTIPKDTSKMLKSLDEKISTIQCVKSQN